METVDKIKFEAHILFAEKGYEETSMREIAGKVGIKVASIYSHYKSKEDIFICVFKNCIEEYALGVDLEDDITDTPLKEKMLRQLKKQIDFLEKNPYLFKFLLRVVFFPPIELKDKLQLIINEEKESNPKKYYKLYNALKKNKEIKDSITINRIISIFDICVLRYFIGNLGLNYYKEQESIESIFNPYWVEIMSIDGLIGS